MTHAPHRARRPFIAAGPGIACLATLLLLAGCKQEAKRTTPQGQAEGEILPGSASDAMLPLDTVRSQAPLAPRGEGGSTPDKADGVKAGPGKPARKSPAQSGPVADAPLPAAAALAAAALADGAEPRPAAE